MDPIIQTFLSEARELLADIEDQLLALERAPDDPEAVNALFRAAHTIKGSAGMFGYDAISGFTHRMENVLSRLRDGELAMSPELAGLLLEARDHVQAMVERHVVEEGELDEAQQEVGRRLYAALGEYTDAPAAADTAPPAPAGAGDRREGAWHLSLRFDPELFRFGFDPLSFIFYLERLGRLEAVVPVADAVPPAAELDPERCLLGFEVRQRGEIVQTEIEDVFEFMRDETDLRILPPDHDAAAQDAFAAGYPEGEARGRELLAACGSERPDPAATEGAGAASGERRQAAGQRPATTAPAATLRVNTGRLDQLVDQVGELVTSAAGTAMHARERGDEALRESAEATMRLVEEVRDTALGLRMVPIGDSFRRLQRVVRDGARELGKQVELVTRGDDTELDKSIAERVGDPLMHLVRNAVDHGLEPPAERAAAGKPERGTVTLEACHESGSIVIEVIDDGRGMDPEAILAKARQRGLVAEEANLGRQEVFSLIFEPGFSTAAQVTNLSGRGVGMDVVRRNVEALRGTVEIDSEPGRGSTFRIRLPLTLSIIDGFLLRVGTTPYVVPLEMMEECLELPERSRSAREHGDYLNLRGEVLPFVHLGELFGDPRSSPDNVVVVRFGERKAGLLVDDLQGETQTVIKPLGPIFESVAGISGATILGSGDVALILDVPGLVQRAGSGAPAPAA